ncbi:DUF4760 domain-containing protein [Utexia brackfieldae]|uniref:DUF4760 domain-containing protein n=1 Tax=Utexia brackfieldae TaxID=3074108 RepID=UPI00370D9970
MELIQLGISILALIVSIIAILLSRKTGKSSKTIDFLFQSREDEKYINALNVISTMYKANLSLCCLIDPDPSWNNKRKEEMRKNFNSVRYILNLYERMAIAIKKGIYDENMIKETSYSTLCRVYQRSKPLIDKIRENREHPTAYIEFERLADKWSKKPLKVEFLENDSQKTKIR